MCSVLYAAYVPIPLLLLLLLLLCLVTHVAVILAEAGLKRATVQDIQPRLQRPSQVLPLPISSLALSLMIHSSLGDVILVIDPMAQDKHRVKIFKKYARAVDASLFFCVNVVVCVCVCVRAFVF
jgi:hypothetical protein